VRFSFVKGHGTGNDFIVLPDPDGAVHGELDAALVRALCDRRVGIGGDGVLRVLSGRAAETAGVIAAGSGVDWFMDYRNADGSVSEMCGNGVRVFARYLESAGLVDVSLPLQIGTRAGVKTVSFCDDGEISVAMGMAAVGSRVKVAVDGRSYAARAVDIGNPHAVVLVDDLSEAGELRVAPEFDPADFPAGVNVEFVVMRGDREVAIRVFERGVGETASCGTGACAVVAAVAAQHDAPAPATYQVSVPGGVLTVRLDDTGEAHLKGPAVLVAEGSWLG
jgi:diaminopimelate epimerase